jgi:hypothetical protein
MTALTASQFTDETAAIAHFKKGTVSVYRFAASSTNSVI